MALVQTPLQQPGQVEPGDPGGAGRERGQRGIPVEVAAADRRIAFRGRQGEQRVHRPGRGYHSGIDRAGPEQGPQLLPAIERKHPLTC